MWDEITYPFPNFNCCIVEVWEVISNYWTCDYLSMLGLKLIQVSKRSPKSIVLVDSPISFALASTEPDQSYEYLGAGGVILKDMGKTDRYEGTTDMTKRGRLDVSWNIIFNQQVAPLLLIYTPTKMRYYIQMYYSHDGVIKWKHFSRYWPFVRGIHRSPVNSPHKGQWRGASMFFFDLRLNKRLSKQSWGWWFETPSRSLWRHCNTYVALFSLNSLRYFDWTDGALSVDIRTVYHPKGC